MLVVQTEVELVPWGSLGRSEYKSKLVERCQRGEPMAANTLNILTPSVNNLTARIFVRAAGLDFEEVDVWGKTTEPEFLAKDPAHAHADARGGRAAARVALGELRDHAVPLQPSTGSTSSTRATPASGRWSTARCSTWSARCIR